MAYVTVPKDLTKIKSKVLFNLTKRQLICFTPAVLIGVPLALVIILGLGGGGAYYYLKVLKPKQQSKAPDDLEDFDFEDEEDYEDEEVAEDYGEASTEETGGDGE